MIIIIIVIIAIIIFFVPSGAHGGCCCSLASYGAVPKVNGIQNHSLRTVIRTVFWSEIF